MTGFGDRVRAARERAGLTREQLAEASGVGASTIAHIESGEHSPTVATAGFIAEGVALTLAQLVDLAGDDVDRIAAARQAREARHWRGCEQ